jgi:hypothetical protein
MLAVGMPSCGYIYQLDVCCMGIGSGFFVDVVLKVGRDSLRKIGGTEGIEGEGEEIPLSSPVQILRRLSLPCAKGTAVQGRNRDRLSWVWGHLDALLLFSSSLPSISSLGIGFGTIVFVWKASVLS